MLKLNLGCGKFPKKGYVNVDINPDFRPDIVADLNKYPYPFKKNSLDEVCMDHCLEHLGDPFRVLAEIHRILKPNGILIVRVPHFSRGFTNADHKHGFDFTFKYFFRKDFELFCGAEYRQLSLRMHWFAQTYHKKKYLSRPLYIIVRAANFIINAFANISPMFCSRIWCFWVGGFEEIEYIFQAVK
jgi:SAM-dependent methyltransferase